MRQQINTGRFVPFRKTQSPVQQKRSGDAWGRMRSAVAEAVQLQYQFDSNRIARIRCSTREMA